ncbi:MAG: dipeptidase [Gemmatimonadales bacterium]
MMPPEPQARARRLMRDAVMWDMVFVYEPTARNDVRMFPRWLDAGFSFVSVHPAGDRHNIGEAMQRLAACRRHILSDDRYLLVDTVDDVRRAKALGKLAVGIHLEGFRCLERNLDLIEVYYRLGVRFCHPVFNLVNSIGGGGADRIDIGLTKFGVKVVQEMNRVGMLVDGAHAGYRTTLDMMEVSGVPMIFSHLGCHSVHPHFRNVRDDQIKGCAERGGVIGITSAGFYLGGVESETYFRHVDHVAQMVGARHVGIGLDYLDEGGLAFLDAFIDARPDEWPDRDKGVWDPLACVHPEQMAEVAELMLQRGYTDEDVRGFLGENWLRICGEVWKPSS